MRFMTRVHTDSRFMQRHSLPTRQTDAGNHNEPYAEGNPDNDFPVKLTFRSDGFCSLHSSAGHFHGGHRVVLLQGQTAR